MSGPYSGWPHLTGFWSRAWKIWTSYFAAGLPNAVLEASYPMWSLWHLVECSVVRPIWCIKLYKDEGGGRQVTYMKIERSGNTFRLFYGRTAHTDIQCLHPHPRSVCSIRNEWHPPWQWRYAECQRSCRTSDAGSSWLPKCCCFKWSSASEFSSKWIWAGALPI